jgi:hypothetical protein
VNLWQGVNGVNNPCPSGYRLPTDVEWTAERLSWLSQNSAGAIGSQLKLAMGGGRLEGAGLLYSEGTLGIYWSSTVSGPDSGLLRFSSTAEMNTNGRARANSVRCIKN